VEEVVVSRPSQWGNPYHLGRQCGRCFEVHQKRGSTIPCFIQYVRERLKTEPKWLEPLVGKRLVCKGCPAGAETCHARVLERFRPVAKPEPDFY